MRKPPVPTRADIPPMGIYTKRDFVKTNTAMPMKPQPTYVDTNKGHKELLGNSGLVPKYIKKKVKNINIMRNEQSRFKKIHAFI